MLRSIKEIIGYDLLATDGPIGHVKDFYFDDEAWGVRYVVVDTGGWLSGRMVLLSPESFTEPDWNTRQIPVGLTKQQIEQSPSVAAERPVSRQKQVQLSAYFGWTPYWGEPGSPPEVYLPGEALAPPPPADEHQGDPHLRSLQEVLDYRIHAQEDKVGHVEDMLAATDVWALRYLVVDTRNWLPGRKVLVSPAWVKEIDWNEGELDVDLSAEAIRNSPEFDYTKPVNREYELKLYDYYGRPHYW
ncbi:MAG: PRC-barrel domain-containing protein [Phycisphaerae bacterium]